LVAGFDAFDVLPFEGGLVLIGTLGCVAWPDCMSLPLFVCASAAALNVSAEITITRFFPI